eukprot:CAMPEP_0185389602 /NCGR_PEP_ID=MMETSP1364-20130426/70574_1 /TAXON_ID=38817 /ORGANISM="Gephyrocapsa oceanica, Strain RCC1303" /LENGTH=36 /DNA_ID= /DNA_START= /DNA_END= /DNA_ORIENTATION=
MACRTCGSSATSWAVVSVRLSGKSPMPSEAEVVAAA